jgi:acyl-CoA thioesterase I
MARASFVPLVLAAVLVTLVAPGCGGKATPPPADGQTGPDAPARPVAAPAPAEAARDTRPLVVFLGDSLTAGYGLPAEAAFPAVLERRLAEEGLPIRVINAGVSGDTTAGGLRRLDWLLRSGPDALVVGLGGNDGLRGHAVEETEANLRAILDRAHGEKIPVLLLGMRMPPNYGPDYTREFAALYPRLAREYGAGLVPFLLDGVGGRRDLNLPDGIHPTEEGQRVVADNVLPHLRKLVAGLGTAQVGYAGASTEPTSPGGSR